MPSGSAHQQDIVLRGALQRLHDDFSKALEGTSATGNSFFALDTELRVDQVRRIVSSVGGAVYWAKRDDKNFIANDSIVSRIFLGFIVGKKRYLPADQFVELLADLCLKKPRRLYPEMEVACFVNLVAAETHERPDHELVIWTSVAHKLATGREKDDLYSEIPGLLTEYDLLYQENAPNAPYMENLVALEPTETLPQYQVRLLASVFPSLTNRISALSNDAERSALFLTQKSQLREYTRSQLRPRLADIFDAEPER